MNIVGIFLNLINVAYRISPSGLRKTWTGHQNGYVVPGYPVAVGFGPPTNLPRGTVPNRFILWGLWRTAVEIYRDRNFKPFAALLFYYGEEVGIITVDQGDIGKVTPAVIKAEDEDAETITPMSISSEAVSSLKEEGLRLRYGFGDQTLSSLDVFLAAFPALTFVAEKGVDSQCDEYRQYGYSTPRTVGLSIQAVQDERGNVKLKYGHVRKAIKKTIWEMVAQRKFRSMQFQLELDGVIIADGEWTQKPREAQLPTLGGTDTA